MSASARTIRFSPRSAAPCSSAIAAARVASRSLSRWLRNKRRSGSLRLAGKRNGRNPLGFGHLLCDQSSCFGLGLACAPAAYERASLGFGFLAFEGAGEGAFDHLL